MARGGFPGGGGMNMQQMLKQAQQMQQRMEQVHAALSEKELEVSAGGGVVTVTMTGEFKLTDIEIKPEVVDPEDVEELQDLIVAAVNEAVNRVNEYRETEMNKVAGGMNLGGLF